MIPKFSILSSCLLLALQTGCVHTPPGTSVEVALARKAELFRLPAPPASAVAKTSPAGGSGTEATYAPEKTERLADAFSRGEFCLGAGKDAEAIDAYQEAVKIDPQFADAWTKLAALYEKTGQEKQAMEAYKKAKMVSADHSRALSAM